jgi:aryl-alcohol dehydrogenase-like predicted oxidoreductase
MRYSRLGATGLKVSALAFGTARLGEIDDSLADRLVGAAIDAGISTFDTADAYNAGASETQLGPLLAPHRDRVVLCTKVGLRVGGTEAEFATPGRDDAERWRAGAGPNDDGLSRKHIMSAIDASLRRLQTDYVDLYQVHRFDPETPIEETMNTLDDLVRAGKVRYVGCSGFAAAQLAEARLVSEQRGLARFASVQSVYSLVVRHCEEDLLPLAAELGVGVLAFGVLAGGMLAGRYHPGDEPAPDTRLGSRQTFKRMYLTDRNFGLVDRLRVLGDEAGRSPAQLAAGWVAAQPGVTSVLAGLSDLEQLRDVVDVFERPLTPEDVTRLGALTA